MRIIWELGKTNLSSRTLAARCGGVSPTVLHRRLRELRSATLVHLQDGRGYALTDGGLAILDVLRGMEVWSTTPGVRRRAVPLGVS